MWETQVNYLTRQIGNWYKKLPWEPFTTSVAKGISSIGSYFTSPHPYFQDKQKGLPMTGRAAYQKPTPFQRPTFGIPERAPDTPSWYNPWAYEPPHVEFERKFGTTKKQVTDFWSEPEQVGLPKTWNIMTEKEKSTYVNQGLPDWMKQHHAGWGDQFEAAAGIAERFGHTGIANELRKKAEGKQSVVGPPQSKAQQIWRALPATEAMIATMILTGGFSGMGGMITTGVSAAATGGARAGAIAALKGFPGVFIRSLGPAALQSAPEAFLEAGHGRNEALANGLSEDEADEVFDRIGLMNMATLTPINALQMAIAFPGIVGRSRILPSIVGIPTTMLTEGGQEVLQAVISRHNLGQEIKWDAQMRDEFILGAMLGGIFGGAGNVITVVQEKVTGTMPEYLKNVYDHAYDKAIKEGVSEEHAKMIALNEVAEDKGGSKWLEQRIKKIHEEERGSIGWAEEEESKKEALNIENLQKQVEENFVKPNQDSVNEHVAKKVRKAQAKPEPKPAQANYTVDDIKRIRESYEQKQQSVDEIKKILVGEVKYRLPQTERGWALNAVRKVKTDKQLVNYLYKLEEKVETYQKKSLKTKINSVLNKSTIKVRKNVKGEVSKLAEVKRIMKRDKTAVWRELEKNLKRIEEIERGTAKDVRPNELDKLTDRNELLSMRPIDEMNSTQLEMLYKDLVNMRDKNRTFRKEMQDAWRSERDELVQEFVTILTGGKGLKKGTDKLTNEQLEAHKSRLGKLVDKLNNWQYGWDNFMDKISYFDKSSKAYESRISQFGAQAHVSSGVEKLGVILKFDEVYNAIMDIYDLTPKQMNQHINNQMNEKINLGYFESLEGDLILTKGQMVKRYMEFKDRTLDESFEKQGYSNEVRKAIADKLTEQDKAYGDWILRFFDDYYYSIDQIFFERYGVHLPKIENYSPIVRQHETHGPDVLPFEDSDGFNYGSVLWGSMIGRKENTSPIRAMDANMILINHIDHAEHFKAWAMTIKKFRSIFKHPDVKNAIIQYHGNDVYKHINNYIDDMARGAVDRRIINKGLDKLRRNFTLSILGAKPLVALKQLLSVAAYATEMDMGDFVSGVTGFWAHPLENHKMAMEKSIWYRDRFKNANMERDIRLANRSGLAQQISKGHTALGWTMGMIRGMDKFAIMQGWYAKYQSVLKQTGDEVKAVQAADQLSKRTQPTFEIETMSSLQRGGSFWKLMTMFQNQPNKYYRIVADNMRNFKAGRGSRTKAFSNIILAWVVMPGLFQLFSDGFRFDREHMIRAAGLGPLNYILAAGNLVQNIYGWVTDEPWDYQPTAVLSSIDDIKYAVSKGKSIYTDYKDPLETVDMDDVIKFTEYMASATGKLGGYPTPYGIMVERAVRDQAPEELVFSRYALGRTGATAQKQQGGRSTTPQTITSGRSSGTSGRSSKPTTLTR